MFILIILNQFIDINETQIYVRHLFPMAGKNMIN